MPTTLDKTRVYAKLRNFAEFRGGRMWYEREGYPNGAWIVEIGSARRVFRSNGSGYPELDWLYVRKVVFPRHDTDFTSKLVPDAEAVFVSMVRQGES